MRPPPPHCWQPPAPAVPSLTAWHGTSRAGSLLIGSGGWATRPPCPTSRAREQAAARKRQLAYRRGGGANLGIRLQEGDPTSTLPRPAVVWRLCGVPRGWTNAALEDYLKGAGWQQVEVLAPPQRRRGYGWLVKGVPPEDVAREALLTPDGTALTATKLTCGSSNLVRVKCRGGNPLGKVGGAMLAASVGEAGAQELPKQAAPLALADGAGDVNMDGGTRGARDADGSAAAKKARTVGPTLRGYRLLECGGGGNCGYNSLAAGLLLGH